MTLRYLGILFLCFFSFWGLGQTRISDRMYIGLRTGVTQVMGLSAFNNSLKTQSVLPLRETVLGGGFDYSVLINRSKLTLNFDYQSVQNGSRLPDTQVLLNCIGLSANYGFNLYAKNESLRIEPFLGFGLRDPQFFVFTHDTTVTLEQVTTGAQNLYYGRPSMGFFVDSGIRIEFYPANKNHRLGFFCQLSGQLQVNRHHWKIEAMNIHQLSMLQLNLGVRFQLFRQTNSSG